ncbi:Ppx/GppA family phosphatase [Brevibacterium casei]|uniref:Ppx/GppA phosphatase n=2 Tax=Brevibacterium casei TaxID=33889 RepID=K9ANX9_9MICO|nr:Ppx/GppA phosphatase family protein [Brevibacterium casei]NJE66232.1 Ppx/GppA family phosphatase [Brevibacterium sp. LS14]EKU49108.1 Ppx/GppA phosphatase [Brevibacterium casei S18]KZE18414.1 exopolyphosphatase [Brevibacterium casei]MCT1447630.1 Ppx/GppA family phosphatase [Brevibacterium casei]QQT68992.1 Ppx/GppA family phosphatase [Brevibacterium casei]
MRVAAFDCGTNSLRLLVADIDDHGAMTELRRETRIVRLGQGVDATGEFAPEALERTFAVTREYAELAAEYSPERIRFVATSASRDVRNRDEFFAGIFAILGVVPDVITGDEEARLSFLGATAGRSADEGPFLVMDLGGGSTELVLGTGDVEAAVSMDIGSVRLTERHMASDQPDGEQIRAAVTDIDTHLDEAAEVVDLGAARTFIGVAGTVTTLTAGILGLDSYQRERIHGARLTVSEVERQADDLVRMDRDARAALPYMHPGRVDVIAAGGLIFARTVSRVDDAVRTRGGELAITVSETDILDGIALDLAS